MLEAYYIYLYKRVKDLDTLVSLFKENVDVISIQHRDQKMEYLMLLNKLYEFTDSR